MQFRVAIALAGLALLQACTFSRPGPLTGEFRDRAAAQEIVIQPLHAPLTLSVPAGPAPLSIAELGDGVFSTDTLANGDVLSITVLEASTGGTTPMLLPQPLQLSAVEVAEDGVIFVPYAGRVPAAGRTIDAVRQDIMGRLAGKIFQPQVSIVRTARPDFTVAIYGDVARGGTRPIQGGMRRLVELIGMAQPQVRNSQNARVLVQRDGRVASVPLLELYRRPENNIFLQPGDTVTVEEDSGYVTLVGATGAQGRVEIDGPAYSILDALASARGLSGSYADPEGVFLIRRGDVAGSPLEIFEVDMRDPVAIAAASQSPARDGDVIVAATASFAQTRQLLGLVAQGFGVTANISRTLD